MKVKVISPKAPLAEKLSEHSLMNYWRVDNLIQIYEAVTKGKKGRKFNSQIDILRAAVVFIHATLEDGLRIIAQHYLPLCDRETIDRIPLLNINSSGRAEKFYLGKLTEHSGMIVDDLVKKSIESYLDKTSFTSIADISELLSSFGINQKKLKPLYPTLEEMIKRRHHIVHKADKIKSAGRGKQYAMSLSARKVKKWNTTALDFLALIEEEYVRPIFWPELENPK